MTKHGTTPVSGVCGFAGEMPTARRKPIGLAPMARAITRLAQARHRVKHLPTVEQIRAMAWFDGREPCSYLLDPEQNLVPELPVGGKDPIATTATRSLSGRVKHCEPLPARANPFIYAPAAHNPARPFRSQEFFLSK